MFSLRATIIIFSILFIPFCLRTCTGVEPFPAVLLPSGAATIKKTGAFITLDTKEIFGVDSNGNWKKIEMLPFLYPIPMRFLPPLLARDFGLRADFSSNKSRRFSVLKKLNLIDNDKKLVSNKRKNVEAWLKQKLIKQHLGTTRIKITSYKKIISTITGSKKSIIKNERTILLDQ